MTLRNIFKNLVANVMAAGAGVIFQICSVPLFLHFWGKILYGEWLVLSSIPAYLALTDFGLGMVLGNTLSTLITAGRRQEAQERLQTIWCFQLGLSALLLLLVTLVLQFGSLPAWLQLTALSGREVTIIVFCLAIYVLLNLNSSVLGAIFRGENQNALGVNCITGVRVWEFAGTLLALVCRANATTVAVVMLLLRASGLGVTAWLAHARFPAVRLGFVHICPAGFKHDLMLGLNFVYITAGYAVTLSGMPLVLNHVLGAAAVVNFTVVRAVCRIALQLYGILYVSIWPEITKLMAAGERGQVRQLNHFVTTFGFWTSLVYAGAMVLGGNLIFKLWTHDSVDPSRMVILGFVVPVVLSTLWTSNSVVFSATNDHKTFAKIFLGASFLSLGGAFLLIPLLGYAGAGLAMGLTDLIVLPYALAKAAEKTDDSPLRIICALFDLKAFWNTALSRWPRRNGLSPSPKPTR
jgi:O-antigen/teichoic acid export membrane protein